VVGVVLVGILAIFTGEKMYVWIAWVMVGVLFVFFG
jgi:hypothetical protein